MYVKVTGRIYIFFLSAVCVRSPVASRYENETVQQVMTFEDLKELGDEEAVKKAGKLRQQGKKYVVQDADVIFFKVGFKRFRKHVHTCLLLGRSKQVRFVVVAVAVAAGFHRRRGRGGIGRLLLLFLQVVPRRLASFPLAMLNLHGRSPEKWEDHTV